MQEVFNLQSYTERFHLFHLVSFNVGSNSLAKCLLVRIIASPFWRWRAVRCATFCRRPNTDEQVKVELWCGRGPSLFKHNDGNGSCVELRQRCCSHHASKTRGNLRIHSGYRLNAFHPTIAKIGFTISTRKLATTSVGCTKGTKTGHAQMRSTKSTLPYVC